MSAVELKEYLSFALEISERAGRETLPYFRSGVDVVNKLDDGGFDPVTEADRAAEQVIRRSIEVNFPGHGIFGEEFGFVPGEAGLTWVIDPIDGTRAFMTGMLHWGVLLALYDGQQPVLGVMHQPYTNEFWYGDNESAFFRRGDDAHPIGVRTDVGLSDAVLATTSPRFIRSPENRAQYQALETAVKLSRYGGDCYLWAMLAMGGVDIAVDGGLNPYDIQALIPIIRGAGGFISTWSGETAVLGGNVVAAGSEALLQQACVCLTS